MLSIAAFVDPNIKQLLNNSQNIITVAPAQIDLDKIFAAFAVALGLSKAGKNSKLLLPQKIKKRVLLSKLSPNLHALLVDSKMKVLRISFASGDIDIEKVNWQRQGDNYNIYIASADEIVGLPKVSLDKSAQLNDAVIAVGIEDPEMLVNYRIYANNLVDYDKTVGIHPLKKAPSPGQQSRYHLHYSQPDLNSHCITVWRFFREYSLPLTKEIATYLLAGIYWKSDSFKYHIPGDFTSAQELIKSGAAQKKAKILGLNNLRFRQMGYFKDIYQNLKQPADGIYYSIIKKDAKKTGQKFFRDLIPFSEIFDAKVAFVVLEDEQFSTVYLKSNISDFNLAEFVKAYQGKGNHSQAYFISSLPTEELVQMLTTELDRSLNLRQRAVQDNLTGPQEDIQKDLGSQIEEEQEPVKEPVIKPVNVPVIEPISLSVSGPPKHAVKKTVNKTPGNNTKVKASPGKPTDTPVETPTGPPAGTIKRGETVADPLAPAESFPEALRLGFNSKQAPEEQLQESIAATPLVPAG